MAVTAEARQKLPVVEVPRVVGTLKEVGISGSDEHLREGDLDRLRHFEDDRILLADILPPADTGNALRPFVEGKVAGALALRKALVVVRYTSEKIAHDTAEEEELARDLAKTEVLASRVGTHLTNQRLKNGQSVLMERVPRVLPGASVEEVDQFLQDSHQEIAQRRGYVAADLGMVAILPKFDLAAYRVSTHIAS